MFKGIANFGALLKQAQQIGGQMGRITEEMRKRRATGAAGGGMVEIEVNGLMEVLACRIDPKLIAQNDREMLEDLVVAAVNQAVARSKQMHVDAMRELTGGLPLPSGLDEVIAQLGENESDEKEGTGIGD